MKKYDPVVSTKRREGKGNEGKGMEMHFHVAHYNCMAKHIRVDKEQACLWLFFIGPAFTVMYAGDGHLASNVSKWIRRHKSTITPFHSYLDLSH